MVARQIKRAPRAVEAALCFIAGRLLAVEVGDRGPAVGLELRIALEVGSRLREIRGRRGQLRLGALHLQPQILGIEARHDVADRDAIADIDDARDNLASDTEAEIGLIARPHHAHEFPLAIRVLEADALDLDRAIEFGRRCSTGFAAGENEQRGEGGKASQGAAEDGAGRQHGSIL